tara:strand:+ start:35734 stop:36543 length:810 start_codon:yes stop_codon:yes gene_type:complete
MLFPFKFKKMNSFFSRDLLTLNGLYSDDPLIFNNAIKYIRFGKFFKTSGFKRLNETYNYIIDLNKSFDNVADIGVSDGSSSLEIVDNLNYKKFFFLDKFEKCKIKKEKDIIYLFDDYSNLHMVETKNFVYYLDPFKIYNNFFSNFLFKTWEKTENSDLKTISFLNPIYKNHKKRNQIVYKKFDLLDNDTMNYQFDLIFLSNLLNKFHKKNKIIQSIKKIISNISNSESIIVIAENDIIERSTIYHKKNDKFDIIKKINGGSTSEKFINL